MSSLLPGFTLRDLQQWVDAGYDAACRVVPPFGLPAVRSRLPFGQAFAVGVCLGIEEAQFLTIQAACHGLSVAPSQVYVAQVGDRLVGHRCFPSMQQMCALLLEDYRMELAKNKRARCFARTQVSVCVIPSDQWRQFAAGAMVEAMGQEIARRRSAHREAVQLEELIPPGSISAPVRRL